MTADMDAAAFVASSKYRAAVLERLDESPATPASIARDVDEDMAHVSRALRELREKGMVELLVAEDTRKGRIYGATDAGAAAYQTAAEIGEVGEA